MLTCTRSFRLGTPEYTESSIFYGITWTTGASGGVGTFKVQSRPTAVSFRQRRAVAAPPTYPS